MGGCHLGLPVHLRLSEDLGGRLESDTSIQQNSADDDSFRAHDLIQEQEC